MAILGVEGVGESYFAIASAPEDKGSLQFLVKDGKGAAGALFQMKEGETVQAQGPGGQGVPHRRIQGTGRDHPSGGHGDRAHAGVIRSILARRSDFGKVSAVFGVRVPQDFPFKNEIKDWEKARIEANLTISRSEGVEWSGDTGYVQTFCEEVIGDLDKPVALVCGMKDMMTQSRDELCRLGVDECDVLSNY